VAVTTSGPAHAALPTGFQEQTVFTGLTNPTVVRFASDGRVFVAEKRGVIKVFDSLTDTTPTVFADLNVNVYNFWDRGLLGMALAPNFPADPYVYVLYTYDHMLGSAAAAPRWGTPGVYSDPCPTPRLKLVVNSASSKAPVTARTVIVGSQNTISAVSPQTKGNKTYTFSSWSDGGAQTHNISAPPVATTYTAQFSDRS
jgi:Glucose / Sorbosone dehydrogenase